ncbi:MAG TPA: Myb-like DNA-binding domain-containing protein [Ignavibacteria bacterium]|nr:Myb-like DNA-binding domain-containing protein [Ignavibacteria bacterium]HMQ97630.1 Myb-like DNA-binding domain-containing protein [Ignavibacteria bacterium]
MKLKRRKATNLPIDWTKKEEQTLLDVLANQKLEGKSIAKLFPKRSMASIRSKARKLKIKHDLFGNHYRQKKSSFTIDLASKINPQNVFDAYAGAGHQSFEWIKFASRVYASESMKTKIKQFDLSAKKNGFLKLKKKKGNWFQYTKKNKKIFLLNGDLIEAATDLRFRKIKIDTVDLDTCGSTIPTLPILLALLKPKHLLITHGEFHSMRFKREDVLRRLFTHRDISKNPFPLKVDEMSKELDKSVKTSALRAHNETSKSFWLVLVKETWLGSKFHGMLRRYYSVKKPPATSDCINVISK